MHFAGQTRFLQYTRYYAYLYNCHPLYLFENISCSIEITYFRPSAIIFLKFVRLPNAQESNLFDKSPISSLHTHNALATLPDLHGGNTAVLQAQQNNWKVHIPIKYDIAVL